jgi:bacillopeptidase F
VHLEDEDPLAGLHLPSDRDARRHAVVARLRERAERSQRRATELLRQRLASGLVARYRSYWIVNLLAVEGGLEAAVALALLPEVVAIEPNRTIQLTLPEVEAASQSAPAIAWGVDKIDAERVWAEWGITGRGIVVANMDSGVDWTHPDLQRKYRGYNAGNPAASDHNYNWFDFTGTYPDAPGPRNISSNYVAKAHGTHVMGTMVGSSPDGGTVVGVAPGAQWIAVKVFDDIGRATEANILAGFQWLLAPTDLQGRNPDPSKAPDVVCNSWGDDAGSTTLYQDSVAMLRAAGIVTVFSAGNAGPDAGTIDAPASYTNTLAMGATASSDTIAAFSSRGPSPWGQIKPDVVAPGVAIVSTIPGGAYGTLSGTSMAAPHAAGTIALMLQADREVLGLPTMTITTTERILRETALDLGEPGPDNTYGYGRLDAYAAVRAVRDLYRIILPLVFRQAPMAAP